MNESDVACACDGRNHRRGGVISNAIVAGENDDVSANDTCFDTVILIVNGPEKWVMLSVAAWLCVVVAGVELEKSADFASPLLAEALALPAHCGHLCNMQSLYVHIQIY